MASVTGAASSLVLVAILTRSLSTADFGRYSALVAVVAFGNALIGSTLGVRTVEQQVANPSRVLRLSVRHDLAGIAVVCLAAFAAAWMMTRPSLGLATALAMVGMLLAEVAGSYLLGIGRTGWFALTTCARFIVWVVLAGICAAVVPERDLLAAMLCVIGVSGGLPFAVLVLRRKVRVDARQATTVRWPVSWVGVCNLSLWLLASGDRVVLAAVSLESLAVYAAIYGLVDRAFRTVATAEIQRLLPVAVEMARSGGYIEPCSSGRMVLVATAAATIGGAVGPGAVSLISGGKYEVPVAMSFALSAAMLLMVLAVPAYVRLIAHGRGSFLAACAGGVAIGNLVGNALLAPEFDTTSATALTLLGYLTWFALVTFGARRSSRRAAS